MYTYAWFQPYARRCALFVLAAAVIVPSKARRGYIATVGKGRRTCVIDDVGLQWFACEQIIGNGCVAGCSIVAWAEWAYLASFRRVYLPTLLLACFRRVCKDGFTAVISMVSRDQHGFAP